MALSNLNNEAQHSETILSVPQAARFLGVHKNTIYKYIESGEIPAFRLVQGGRWKIKRDELEEWLQVRQRRAGK